MSIELDAMRVALSEENANWRALTASDDITETLTATINELRAKHAALKADLPKAIATHTAAVTACDRAQRRRNTVVGRVNRVAPGRLSPVLGTLLGAEAERYRAAQIAVTRAQQTLAALRWDIECLSADLGQTEAVLAPPAPQLMEVATRPPTEVVEVDDIVFPVLPRNVA
jgi:hypothetical protein